MVHVALSLVGFTTGTKSQAVAMAVPLSDWLTDLFFVLLIIQFVDCSFYTRWEKKDEFCLNR
jgi:uncharacterized membrane protein